MDSKFSNFKIILGSSSVARRKILTDMGYEFKIMSPDIDEKNIRKDKPEDLVMALAEAKANAVIQKIQNAETLIEKKEDDKPTIFIAADTAEAIIPKLSVGDSQKDAEPTILITCDQVVVYEGKVREKPSSKEEARQFIKGYSDGHAATVSSVSVTNLKTGVRKGEWDRVEIYFHTIPDNIIESLIDEGNVLHVAGALIIEHPMIVPYVKEVVGTTDSVMGLPIAVVERLMRDVL